MSAHAETDHAAHPPAAHQSSRVDARTLGMFLFIASEVMLFGSFFTAYFFVRVVNHQPWPPHPFHLPVFVAFVNTCILVTSSFTMHWALQSIKHGNRAGMQAGLTLTFLMGVTFLLTQLLEYARVGFTPHDQAFGTIFFCLTGLHGAHVFVDDDTRLPRPLFARASPRRRDRRDLLALRGRNVDSRLHDRLHPLSSEGPCR
jgi:cytochrome c oxidase subunit 3